MSSFTLSIFFSSPGDVKEERKVAKDVVNRLQREFSGRIKLEPIFWEEMVMESTGHFQDQIPLSSDSQIAVFILWSRLGTPMPAGKFRRKDGTPYDSGTEFEFETALEAHQEKGLPHLLTFRKKQEPKISLNIGNPGVAKEFEKLLGQKKKLDEFVGRWFVNPDGTLNLAYNSYNDITEFETILTRDLRDLITHFARESFAGETTAPESKPWWFQGSPYLGLKSFDMEHAPVFFGRTRAIIGIKNALVSQAEKGGAFLFLLGMSGCGKTSLLQAGVLPYLIQPGEVDEVNIWRWSNFKPSDAGVDLLLGLVSGFFKEETLPQLKEEGITPEDLTGLFRTNQKQAVNTLIRGLDRHAAAVTAKEGRSRPLEGKLIVIVDQMEELLTIKKIGPKERQELIAVLGALAQSGKVWIIAAARGDFYPRLIEIPGLVPLAEGAGSYVVPPPTASEIEQMIYEPAVAAGLTFEKDPQSGVALDQVIHEKAVETPEALPLLEFLLNELYDSKTESGMLTYEAYHKLGGLEGALATRAEEVYHSLEPRVKEVFPIVFRALATVETGGGEHLVRKYEDWDDLAGTPEREKLLNVFIEARLLTSDRGSDGKPVVRVIHEALLRSWPRLKEQLEKDRRFLRVRERVAGFAERWRQEQKNPDLLLQPGLPLEEARDLLKKRPEDLEAGLVEYIRASLKKVNHERRIRQSVAVAVFLLVLGTAVFSSYQYWVATVQHNATLSNESLLSAEKSRQETRDGNRMLGLRLAATVLPENMKKPDRPYVVEAECSLYMALYNKQFEGRAILKGHQRDVDFAAFSPDGSRIVTASWDNTARIWDAGSGKMLRILAGHTNWVIQAVFSPDGKRIVTASMDKTARLWDAENGKELFIFKQMGIVNSASFSPDGRKVVTASLDNTAVVWDASNWKALLTLANHSGGVNQALFSPDGKYLVTGSSDHTARVWDAANGKELAMVKQGKEINHVAVSPNGRSFATASSDLTARVWEMANGREILTVRHADRVNFVAFSADGKLIVTASSDKTARVWDAVSGKELFRANHGNAVNSAVFSPDGKFVGTASHDRTAQVWEVKNQKQLAVLAKHSANVIYSVFSPDGKLIVTTARDETARIWDLESESNLVELRHDAGVNTAGFSPDGKRVITASMDGSARVWDTESGRELALIKHADTVNHALFSPDGKRLVTVSSDKTARVLEIEFGRELVLNKHRGRINHAAFSPDGKRIVTVSADKTARVWNAGNGAELLQLVGHTDEVLDGVFSPDGKLIATTSTDNTARVWDAQNGRLLKTLGKHMAKVNFAAFSPDGSRIVTVSSDKTARVWDVASGNELLSFAGHTDEVFHAAFSPDGKTIVTASMGSVAYLWDGESGRIMRHFKHPGGVFDAGFSPDGKRVVTASEDKTARVWDVETGQELAELAKHTAWVNSASFSPDGRWVVTSSSDGSAIVWRIFPTTQELVDYARTALIPRPLLPQLAKGRSLIVVSP